MQVHRFIFMLTVFAAVVIASRETSAFQGNSEVIKNHLEAIKSRGEPTTRQEIEERRNAFEPGVEDVSEIWRKGMQPLQTLKYFERDPPIPTYFAVLGFRKCPLPHEEWPDLGDVERHLKDFEPSLKQFHEAGRRGGHGRMNPVTVWSGERTNPDELFGGMNATNLLAVDVVVQSRKGNTTGCFESLLALLSLSRSEHNRPGILGFVSPSATDDESAKAFARVLFLTPFSNAELAKFREIIKIRRSRYSLEQTYLEERIIDLDVLANPVEGPFIRKSPALSESDWTEFFQISQQIIDNARKPFPEALDAAEQLTADLEKRINDESLPESRSQVLRLLRGRGYWNWFAGFACLQVHESGIDAAIAVEHYRREHGKFPESLESLIPKFMPSVPRDPFNGKPLIYKVTDQGIWIYSVGKNRVDDGGRIDKKPDDNYPLDEGLFFPLK